MSGRVGRVELGLGHQPAQRPDAQRVFNHFSRLQDSRELHEAVALVGEMLPVAR